MLIGYCANFSLPKKTETYTMANRIVAVPPITGGAPCTMLSKVTDAQECDATDDDSSNTAD